MTADLLIIVPTRGRPQNVVPVIESWKATGAFDDGAELLFVLDRDDPQVDDYETALQGYGESGGLTDAHSRRVRWTRHAMWQPLVPKLNRTSKPTARTLPIFAQGFAGDDHRPRTPGWAARYLEALRELGTGIVYGDDLVQGEALPSQWAMTTDIIRALGRMVPAPVEHMYCDDSILKLGQAAGCIRYLPDVVIEHQHPIAGTAPDDEGYRRVNSQAQLYRDRLAYGTWLAGQMATDVATVRKLKTEVNA